MLLPCLDKRCDRCDEVCEHATGFNPATGQLFKPFERRGLGYAIAAAIGVRLSKELERRDVEQQETVGS